MIQWFSEKDNVLVRGGKGIAWVIFQSGPISQASFLRSVLEKRFSDLDVSYLSLEEAGDNEVSTTNTSGVLAELKEVDEAKLPAFDRILRQFKSQPIILILSPQSYQFLQQRRKKVLQKCTITLSDIKNLDYLVHVPRLIEEALHRNALKEENARLRELIEQAQVDPGYTNQIDSDVANELIVELIQEKSGGPEMGLRLELKNWPHIKRQLGPFAETELVELLSRAIHSVIRNSDRVLRSRDDEFLIILKDSQPTNLKVCLNRLEQELAKIRVEANNQMVSLPFAISPFEAEEAHL